MLLCISGQAGVFHLDDVICVGALGGVVLVSVSSVAGSFA